MPTTRYVLTFVAWPETDGPKAVRSVLKYALRAAGLRCVEVQELVEPMCERGPTQGLTVDMSEM